jgi:Fe-S oxidoreductase
MSAVLPANGTAYSVEEASSEAGRCVRCRCDACFDICNLVSDYQKYPARIKDEIIATSLPGRSDMQGAPAKRIANACSQCGLLKANCPEKVNLCDLILDCRQKMHQNKKMPWIFHDYWLRDMAFAMSAKAHIVRMPHGYNKSAYAFFPGCQLGASDPRYVERSYELLLGLNPDTSIMLSCCGAPAEWAGDTELHQDVLSRIKDDWRELGNPVLITACPTCDKKIHQYLPEIATVSLYELLDKYENTPMPQHASEQVHHVFDPCSVQEMPDVRMSVRNILRRAGYKIDAEFWEKEAVRCCGYGGHPAIADSKHVNYIIQSGIQQSPNDYITYCINCKDYFVSAGKPCIHLLDIILGLVDEPLPVPTATQRNANRIKLKNLLLEKHWNEPSESIADSGIRMEISGALRQKLSRKLILEEDIVATVESCERSGQTIRDEFRGTFVGFKTIGHVTYWVEYRKSGNRYELVNAYCHHMKMVLEDVWDGRKTTFNM